MTHPNVRCKTCLWWNNAEFTEDEQWGKCRRHAPRLSPRIVKEELNDESVPFGILSTGVWPLTFEHDYCGDHVYDPTRTA